MLKRPTVPTGVDTSSPIPLRIEVRVALKTLYLRASVASNRCTTRYKAVIIMTELESRRYHHRMCVLYDVLKRETGSSQMIPTIYTPQVTSIYSDSVPNQMKLAKVSNANCLKYLAVSLEPARWKFLPQALALRAALLGEGSGGDVQRLQGSTGTKPRLSLTRSTRRSAQPNLLCLSKTSNSGSVRIFHAYTDGIFARLISFLHPSEHFSLRRRSYSHICISVYRV